MNEKNYLQGKKQALKEVLSDTKFLNLHPKVQMLGRNRNKPLPINRVKDLRERWLEELYVLDKQIEELEDD